MNKLLVLISVFASFSCSTKDVVQDIPPCIRQKIDLISEERVWNPPAKIYSYVYQDEIVYYIQAHCCDIPSELYDENCNRLCFPDGGFTGKGDGRCPDFFDTRTAEKLVWEDSRK